MIQTESNQIDPDDLPTVPETIVPGSPFPANTLGDSVLSPGRSAGDADQYGSSLTVITRQQIQQTRRHNVADVLRQTVGVDVARSGGPGGTTSIFLRGGNSAHTKVMLDGIPLNDPSHPTRAFDFGRLSVDNVERIEVLRGPQSMVYGSDAIGGVINIVTRRGDGPPRLRSVSEGGSFGTARQLLSVSGGDESHYYSLAGSYLHTDGVSRAARHLGNTERDRQRLGTISGRFGWNPTDVLNVDYVFRYLDSDTEVDDFAVDNLIRENLTNELFQRVQAQSVCLDGASIQKVGFSHTDFDRRDTDPGFLDPRFDGQSRQFDWQGQFLLHPGNTVVGGVDYLHEEASSTSAGDATQNNTGLYIEDRIQIGDRLFGTAGFRWDEHSAAGRAQTYRFTTRFVVWETKSTWHGSLGTGFRSPSLAEKFFPFGNAALLPERSKGWDAGVTQEVGSDAWFDVTYFRNQFRNLIVFDLNTFLSQNIGRAQSTGLELTAGWRLNDVTDLTASYTFNDTSDVSFGGKLPRRPQQKASATISRRYWCDRAQANLYVVYVGDRLDFDQRFGGTVLDDYVLMNLSTSFQWNDRVEFFTRIDNALDEDYEEAGFFGSAGVAAYGGLVLQY
ncbi:MAG: TonB-dependent receptor [Pirellulaceae bacterium]|nr:TonB-dependent receptor [Pirellulaceae bacterium]MDP7017105.1 TonB-dependent receptor [Pirellulaceae bacterium]